MMDHAFIPGYGLWSLVIINSLALMCAQLARREERDAPVQFGDAYSRCEANMPAFVPAFGARAQA